MVGKPLEVRGLIDIVLQLYYEATRLLWTVERLYIMHRRRGSCKDGREHGGKRGKEWDTEAHVGCKYLRVVPRTLLRELARLREGFIGFLTIV